MSVEDPPLGGDVDFGKSITAIFTTECIFSMLVVATRFLCRRRNRTRVGLDDWAMLGQWVLSLLFTIIVCILAGSGGLRPNYYLTDRERYFKINVDFASVAVAALAQGWSKVRIALLLLRVMDKTAAWRKWFLWIVMILTMCLAIVRAASFGLHCSNPDAFWVRTDKPLQYCWTLQVQASLAIFQSGKHAPFRIV